LKYPVLTPSIKEEFEDAKGAIRIRISKKNRQHNGQKKKYKRTNNDQQKDLKKDYENIAIIPKCNIV
jgi:hypothetical protein